MNEFRIAIAPVGAEFLDMDTCVTDEGVGPTADLTPFVSDVQVTTAPGDGKCPTCGEPATGCPNEAGEACCLPCYERGNHTRAPSVPGGQRD